MSDHGNKSVEEVLEERGSSERYGDFTNNAIVAQQLKDVLQRACGWGKCRPTHRESLDLICTKLSRIVTGNPEYADNWIDIGGFSKLAADRCIKGGKK